MDRPLHWRYPWKRPEEVRTASGTTKVWERSPVPREAWVVLDEEQATRDVLSPTERAIFLFLRSLMKGGKPGTAVQASYARIKAGTGFSTSTVRRAVKRLVAKHVVGLWDAQARRARKPREDESAIGRKRGEGNAHETWYVIRPFAEVLKDLATDPDVGHIQDPRSGRPHFFKFGRGARLMSAQELADWGCIEFVQWRSKQSMTLPEEVAVEEQPQQPAAGAGSRAPPRRDDGENPPEVILLELEQALGHRNFEYGVVRDLMTVARGKAEEIGLPVITDEQIGQMVRAIRFASPRPRSESLGTREGPLSRAESPKYFVKALRRDDWVRRYLPQLLIQGFGVPDERKIEFQGLAVEWIRKRGTAGEKRWLVEWEQGLIEEARQPAFPPDDDEITGKAAG